MWGFNKGENRSRCSFRFLWSAVWRGAIPSSFYLTAHHIVILLSFNIVSPHFWSAVEMILCRSGTCASDAHVWCSKFKLDSWRRSSRSEPSGVCLCRGPTEHFRRKQPQVPLCSCHCWILAAAFKRRYAAGWDCEQFSPGAASTGSAGTGRLG